MQPETHQTVPIAVTGQLLDRGINRSTRTATIACLVSVRTRLLYIDKNSHVIIL